MKCSLIRIGGAVGFICGRRRIETHYCSFRGCHAVATLQCDFPLLRHVAAQARRRRCDEWLCIEHAVHREPNKDYCLHHHLPAEQLGMSV